MTSLDAFFICCEACANDIARHNSVFKSISPISCCSIHFCRTIWRVAGHCIWFNLVSVIYLYFGKSIRLNIKFESFYCFFG
jgi:hypothetical protein